jgi:hypothetical protein
MKYFIVLVALSGLVPSIQAQSASADAAPAMQSEEAALQAVEESTAAGQFKPQFHPRLGFLSVYDDNFLQRDRDEIGDFIFTTSPGFDFQLGERDGNAFILAEYTMNIIRFLEEDQNDSEDQDALLVLGYKWDKFTLQLEQQVQTLSDATLDIGTRTQRDVYNTLLTGMYDYSDKTFIDVTFGQFVTNYTTSLADRMEWVAQALVNYRISPKITVGVGPRIGWVDIDSNPNQTYQGLAVRTTWEATDKLTATLITGFQVRQYQDDAVDDKTKAYFNLGISYLPFDGTTIEGNVFRDERNSAVRVAQNYVSTGFTASLRQRFLEKFFFGLSGGFENTDYEAASTGAVFANRDDDFFSVRPSLTWLPNERLRVEAFYLYRQNESNIQSAEFWNNQIGLSASFRY